ncbi:MAG: DUF4124 domain-containing protein [Guyparkeria sp.]
MQGMAAHPTPLAHRDTSPGHATARLGMAAAVAALTLLMFAANPAGAATIYKSVDEHGNVQFSQTPPKDRPSEEIDARGAAEPSQPPSVETPPSEEEAEGGENDPADPATETKVVDREKARETCQQAREQRESVANDGNQLMVQGEDGKYQPMSDEQRAERLERLDAIIEEACSAAEQ